MRGRYITLYHFCAGFDVRSILSSGLSKGMTPIWENGKFHTERKTQWMTEDGAPGRQSWNTQNLLPYSRTEYRLTIRIPFSHRKKLVRAGDFMAQYPKENAGLVANWPGSEHWFVYRGTIPPAWIVGCKKMEVTQ